MFCTILQWHCNFNFNFNFNFKFLTFTRNVFPLFTGKLLKTLENTIFHKTCYLEAKTNVLHNFPMPP